MLPFPDMDPTIIEIGPLKLRWYGLAYVLGFIAAHILISIQQKARRMARLQALIFFLAAGLVIGPRLGYIHFYQWARLGEIVAHPLDIIAVWHGGMSFQGGLIGAVVSSVLCCQAENGREFC